jgi:hypothetical protein
MRRSAPQCGHPIGLLEIVNEVDDGALPVRADETPGFYRIDFAAQFEIDDNDVGPESEAALKSSACGRQNVVDSVSERRQQVREVRSDQIVFDDE